MPNGGSIPGETALNARVQSFTASLVTTQYMLAAKRYVAGGSKSS